MLKDRKEAPIKIHFYSLVSMPEQVFNQLVKEVKEKATESKAEVTAVTTQE